MPKSYLILGSPGNVGDLSISKSGNLSDLGLPRLTIACDKKIWCLVPVPRSEHFHAGFKAHIDLAEEQL